MSGNWTGMTGVEIKFEAESNRRSNLQAIQNHQKRINNNERKQSTPKGH